MSHQDETSPLLAAQRDDQASENDPLLSSHDNRTNEDDDESNTPKPRRWWPWSTLSRKSPTKDSSSRRWPSIAAIVILAVLVVVIVVLGFMIPPAVERYAKEAIVVEPTGLSLESLTSNGVRARIQVNLRLDGSRVKDIHSRRIGSFVTGAMRKFETEQTELQVRLPGYGHALLGTAIIPSLVVDVRNGYDNHMDFITDLSPGDTESIRSIVNEWLVGDLKQLKVTGSTAVQLKSGIFPLGTHDLKESLVIEAKQVPSMPQYDIGNLNFQDGPTREDGSRAVAATVSITAANPYPVSMDVPPLAFDILVPNCDASEPKIRVADAITNLFHVSPKANVTADAEGFVNEIPDSLIRQCPESSLSPLDTFVKHYLRGEDATIFVRGKKTTDMDTPDWVGDILSSITVPVEFPGSQFNDFIRNFSLSDVDFKLPSPFADPNDPDSQPKVSGSIQVLGALPPGFNISVGVEGIRADADLFFEKRKLGELNLRQWQSASSTSSSDPETDQTLVNVTSRIVDAPLNITDGDVFGDVLRRMLFGNADIILDVESAVDVKVNTVLGRTVFNQIPARGKIPIKKLPGDPIRALHPHVSDIRIIKSSTTGIEMEAIVDITNPTPYIASVPFVSVHIVEHGLVVGEAIARNVEFTLGKNKGLKISAIWDPTSYGGEEARAIGRQVLSEYVSGKNTTLTLRAHAGTIPTLPLIGEALSKIDITVPTPHLGLPRSGGNHTGDDGDSDGDDDDDKGGVQFISEAIFHIFGSAAIFTLASPLHYDTLYVESINATAFYNHTEPIGRIIYDEPFPVVSGISNTPPLPVQWSLASVGYQKLREALGGTLKLDARANVTVRVGNWVETLEYDGKGIGAKVRL